MDRNERVKRSISSRLLLRLMIARSASFLANTPICSGKPPLRGVTWKCRPVRREIMSSRSEAMPEKVSSELKKASGARSSLMTNRTTGWRAIQRLSCGVSAIRWPVGREPLPTQRLAMLSRRSWLIAPMAELTTRNRFVSPRRRRKP
ncbi:Uncharacterised protein [Klebsiella pneumoniae]|nr:Uncharacterised protein [Klebsiella pneumoniae]